MVTVKKFETQSFGVAGKSRSLMFVGKIFKANLLSFTVLVWSKVHSLPDSISIAQAFSWSIQCRGAAPGDLFVSKDFVYFLHEAVGKCSTWKLERLNGTNCSPLTCGHSMAKS